MSMLPNDSDVRSSFEEIKMDYQASIGGVAARKPGKCLTWGRAQPQKL